MSETRYALYSRILKELEAELPEGFRLYSVDGRRLFEVRGEDWTPEQPVVSLIFYIITQKDGDWFKNAVEVEKAKLVDLPLKRLLEELDGYLKKGMKDFKAYLEDPAAVAKAREEFKERQAEEARRRKNNPSPAEGHFIP